MGMCADDGVAAAREGAPRGAEPWQPMCYAVISPGLAGGGSHRLELKVEHVPGGPHSVACLAVWVVRHFSLHRHVITLTSVSFMTASECFAPCVLRAMCDDQPIESRVSL